MHESRALLPAAWRLTTPFWRSRAALRAWVMVALIGLIFYASARLALWYNGLGGTMTNAVVAKDMVTLRPLLRWSIAATLGGGLLSAILIYLLQWIEIDWRRDMTDRLLSAWLANDNHYRLERDQLIGNADQRIAEDTFLFVDNSVRITNALVGLPVSIAVYAQLLWTLGGAVDLAAIGISARLPGGTLWIAILGIATFMGILLLVGYPLLGLNVERQRREADFRFSLANIRMNAEQIALYGGRNAETRRLDRRLDGIVSNWHRIMLMTMGVIAAVSLYNAATDTGTMVLSYGRYARREIDFGQMTQIGGATVGLAMSIHTFIEFFTNGIFYTWAAAVRRLDAFAAALARHAPHGITIGCIGDGMVATTALRLSRPDGTALATIGDRHFTRSERWLVRGASGSGKSTLLRALAGLWPYGQGEVLRDAASHLLFLPQKSYVPEGPLRDALCYPSRPGRFTDRDCAAALEDVRLSRLAKQLDEEARWQERLSPGEQQRLAFARILLQRPDVILLDEATSALDDDNEAHLYTLIGRRLPHATIISVAHRQSVACFHDHSITIGIPSEES